MARRRRSKAKSKGGKKVSLKPLVREIRRLERVARQHQRQIGLALRKLERQTIASCFGMRSPGFFVIKPTK